MAKERAIRIYSYGDGRERLIHVTMAATLKGALEYYWKCTLKAYGYTDPIFKGNTLTVKDLQGIDLHYKAVEA